MAEPSRNAVKIRGSCPDSPVFGLNMTAHTMETGTWPPAFPHPPPSLGPAVDLPECPVGLVLLASCLAVASDSLKHF